MSKAARILAVGVAAAALALTGCSPSPSTAAVVEGVPVSNDVVQRSGQALIDAAALGADTSYRQAAFDLALGEASRHIAAQNGVQVGESEKQKLLAADQEVGSIMGNPDAWAWGDAVATTFLVNQKMGQDRFVAALKEVDIEINPLYGQWDADRVTMVDAALSRDAAGSADLVP